MGNGRKNTAPQPKGHRIGDLDQEALRLYTEIRLLTKKCMRDDYTAELFEYRARYRFGRPTKIHYSWKTRMLQNLLDRVGRSRVETDRARMELKQIRRMY